MKTTSHATIVLLLACIAHAPALTAGFVWLDHAHIESGLAILPLGHLHKAFSQGFAGTGFYRPVMSIALSLDAALSGAPWLYHANNLICHGVAGVLVLLFGRSCGLRRQHALAAACLFVTHPMTSVVADAIAFRSEALFTIALLAMLICHEKGRPFGAAMALLLAGLTKETGLLLAPLFLIGMELHAWRRQDFCWPSKRRLYAMEGASWLMGCVLRLKFAPSWRASHIPLPASEAIGTRLASFSKYALRFATPWQLEICDSFPITSVVSFGALLGGMILLALLTLAWKRGGLSMLLGLSLLPCLQLVPIMRWWSPHYVYLPLVFALLLLVPALAQLVPKVAAQRVWLVAAIFPLMALSAIQAKRFRSDRALWTPEVAQDEACREGHFYLADAARAENDHVGAVAHLESALAANSAVLAYVDRGAALQNLGAAYLTQRKFAAAEAQFEAALALAHNTKQRQERIHNLALAALAGGSASRAIELLSAEQELHPATALLLERALAVRDRQVKTAN